MQNSSEFQSQLKIVGGFRNSIETCHTRTEFVQNFSSMKNPPFSDTFIMLPTYKDGRRQTCHHQHSPISAWWQYFCSYNPAVHSVSNTCGTRWSSSFVRIHTDTPAQWILHTCWTALTAVKALLVHTPFSVCLVVCVPFEVCIGALYKWKLTRSHAA